MDKDDANQTADRKKGSGVKLVYDVLRDEIIDLSLAPGSPIDENQLAERFSMSRTPIREALVRLLGGGLVTTPPTPPTGARQRALLGKCVLPGLWNGEDQDRTDQQEDSCDRVGCHRRNAVKQAARNRTDKDLENIRAHQEAFARAVRSQNALEMIATNRDFHAAIAEAGRNPFYTTFFSRLLDEGRRLLRLYYQSFADRLPERYVTEHEDMIRAIEERDVDTADLLGKAHGDQIVYQIRKLIAEDRRDQLDL